MSNPIFLIGKDDALIPMREKTYESEKILQELLAKYPDLLLLDEDDLAAPRFILVKREAPVPVEPSDSGTFSLDHLFLDQNGIPTLVEVKRSSNTQLRREVVAQMLDYAANAVIYWSIESIQAMFNATWQNHEQSSEMILQKFLGENADINQYWITVKTNLAAGRIRMLFIADEIPKETRRIIEFLNGQMQYAEVLAIEIRQFVGEGVKTLVPQIIGQTTQSVRTKNPVQGRTWTEETFMERLSNDRSEDEVNVARQILEWAKKRNIELVWGKGASQGSCSFKLLGDSGCSKWMNIWTTGVIGFRFNCLRSNPPFDNDKIFLNFLQNLNSITGASFTEEQINSWADRSVRSSKCQGNLTKFFDLIDRTIEEIKNKQISG